MKDVLREAQDLVTDGASELVLVAQDTAAYGRDRAGSGRPSLDGLMTGLLGIRGFRWLRLMYAHPAHLTDDIIELLSEKRVARYLDLPIQHADDGVLAAMNRPYGSAHLRGLIAKLRRKVPGIALRTTCLVGFPGETTKAFRNLMDFARESCFDHLGAFAYSREPGTAAARLSGQVDEKTKAERLDRLMSLQKTCSRKAGTARVGQTLEVLVEKVGPESVEGRSQFQAPEVDGKTIVSGSQAGLKRLKPGAFCKAKVTAAKDYDLAAEMI